MKTAAQISKLNFSRFLKDCTIEVDEFDKLIAYINDYEVVVLRNDEGGLDYEGCERFTEANEERLQQAFDSYLEENAEMSEEDLYNELREQQIFEYNHRY